MAAGSPVPAAVKMLPGEPSPMQMWEDTGAGRLTKMVPARTNAVRTPIIDRGEALSSMRRLGMPSPCELPLKPCSAISEVGLPRVRDRKAESGRWKSFNASISTTNALKTCRLRRLSMWRIRPGKIRLRRTPFAQDGQSS